MKKQITTITLGILMIASAMAMYTGDSMTFEVNLTNPFYTVVGNSSNLEGLNITFENGNITISSALNYKADNFTLIFFDNITMEVEKIVYRGGGGGTRLKYVDKNVTVYVPEYIETNITHEVEKIVDNTTVVETGFKLWMVLFAMVVGGVFVFFMMRKKGDEAVEEEL